MKNLLYIAWQDPDSRHWYPIAQLFYDGKKYSFTYTRGAEVSPTFRPFQGMEQLDIVYESRELFPFFSNRILSKSRPEYASLLKWLKIDQTNPDPLSILALTGGFRKTDSFEIFACPSPTGKKTYEILFFSHGLSHLEEAVIDRVNGLPQHEQLFLLLDIQNDYDPLAIALRTDDPITIVGYCPRYLNEDFRFLANSTGPESLRITVEQVNMDAPLQFRLLCRFVSPWPGEFKPCTDKFYQVLAGSQGDSCGSISGPRP